MATAAQIEANRRNSQKTSGPRTEEGKNRSRLNALDHGGRALLPVLPTENPGEYEAQCHAFRPSIKPRNPSEEALINRMVTLDLQLKRIRRAQTARLNKRMSVGWIEEDDREEEKVLELGQKLFRGACDLRSLQLDFPMGQSIADAKKEERVSEDAVAADHPERLVHGLKSTKTGCEWLLEHWDALRDLLERDLPWLASDRLKAVRLLGRHPIDAIDFPDVARIYLAGHAILKQRDQPFQEIFNELSSDERSRYQDRLKRRGCDALALWNAADAKANLLEIVDAATEVLEDRGDVFREPDEVDLHTASARLSWDDTPEGERLRRYELTCSRAWSRAFELLLQVRRTGQELDFATITSFGRSHATGNVATITKSVPVVATVSAPPPPQVPEPAAPNEPNSDHEKLPNEPNSHVHETTAGHRDGQKAFRIDAPQTSSKVGAHGPVGRDREHPGLHGLEIHGQAPLMNLSAIFGKS